MSKKCLICKDQTKLLNHHISYKKDKTVQICKACHMWLHGQARVYRHKFKKRFKPDKSPIHFAKAVVKAYESKN